MIQGTYYKEWSSVLNREMEFKVYGSAGVPVLALPARGGRFYDWENNGMPDAIAPLLNEGKVQLFCADSIDGEAVLNGDAPVRRRAEMEEKYFVYLTAELAPRVLALNGAAKDAKLWCVGIDLGAVHAVNCRLRRPKLFAGAIGLSGIYDLARFWGSEADDLVLRCSPAVSGRERHRRQAGSGQGRGEQPDALRRSGCLRGRCQSRHAGAGRCAGRTGPARPPRGLGRRCLPRVVLVGQDAGPVCAADSGEVKVI